MIGVTVNGNPAADFAQWQKDINIQTQRVMLLAATHVASEIDQTVKSMTGQSDMSKRGPTGNLARSFRAVNLPSEGGKLRAGAFSDLVYAEIQDQGGTIYPRNGKHLAIPLVKLPVGTWPRNYSGDLKYLKSKKGNKLLAVVTKTAGRKRKGNRRGRSGRKLKIKPIFLLKESVTLEGKHYIDKATPGAVRAASKIIEGAIIRGLK